MKKIMCCKCWAEIDQGDIEFYEEVEDGKQQCSHLKELCPLCDNRLCELPEDKQDCGKCKKEKSDRRADLLCALYDLESTFKQ